MQLLPIGTVVTFNNGEQELMITARFPLYNNNGEIGYFDYAGCFYPQGQFDDNSYFFNVKDIKTVHFIGYISPAETELQKTIREQLKTTPYPKLALKKD